MLSGVGPDPVLRKNTVQIGLAVLTIWIDLDAGHLPTGKFTPPDLATIEYHHAVVARIGLYEGDTLVNARPGTFQNLHKIQPVERKQTGQFERVVPLVGLFQNSLKIGLRQIRARGADITK